jgi:SAM-dependent methyltransferase
VDLAEYRRTSHDIWQKMAAGWERRAAWMWEISNVVGEDMVSRLDPQPGQTVLELAAGTGETGFTAAALLGDDGRLISTDFSAEMVAAAGRRAQELGLRNVEVRVMDAERMDLPDDSVDGVLCRWGYMLMADPAAALAETRRVLRDGGRLSLSVWGEAARNPWAAMAGGALVQHGHREAPKPGEPGIFAMASEDRIRELVTGAGFGEPDIRQVAVEYRFDAFEEYWQFLVDMAGGIAVTLEQLTDEQRTEVYETVEQSAQAFSKNGGFVMPGVALNAVAD